MDDEPERSVSGDGGRLDCELLRTLLITRCDLDPGPLGLEHRLDDVQLSGFNLLRAMSVLENVFEIDFPADLISAVESIDDLVHFTNLKIDQRSTGAA